MLLSLLPRWRCLLWHGRRSNERVAGAERDDVGASLTLAAKPRSAPGEGAFLWGRRGFAANFSKPPAITGSAPATVRFEVNSFSSESAWPGLSGTTLALP